MPSVEKQRERLIGLLEELFQLDQPDLDFGFYKIMHAKADHVSEFLKNDLLSIIKDAFGDADAQKTEEARLAYEAAIKQAKEFGAPDPEATEPVKKAKALYETEKDSGTSESEVYDHLYRFFERYYDNGDFMSRRYYARETDGKAAAYSVPYDGREVYLHWANRDQYYIKTSEYLNNFIFNPTKALEYEAHHGKIDDTLPVKVHCKIVDATEGEHNNVKVSEKTERYFIIHAGAPVKLENDEMVIQFEYRSDPEKTGNENTWRKKRLEEAVEAIKQALSSLAGGETFQKALLDTPAPTEKEPKRTLLEKYLTQYTARNTMDYFIHKDLGGFLRRELDFYIKNEIMHLDDIESADAPKVELYLAKIKVLRKIAHYLIDFLTQLEEFQKKLWLKKKFVLETNYCITLDRIPESFYEEIVANDLQREEWIRLFAIEEIEKDLHNPGYSNPLTMEFLKANPFLVLDTALFKEELKDRLLAEIQDLDEKTDGLLIHSENFQTLNLLMKRYRELVSGIYIDPPYNTNATEIHYKNSYKHSSWLSLMSDRVLKGKEILRADAKFCLTIDDYEASKIWSLMNAIFDQDNHLGTTVIRINPGGRKAKRKIAAQHEYALFYSKYYGTEVSKWEIDPSEKTHNYKKDLDGNWYEERNLRKEGADSFALEGAKRYFPIYYDPTSGRISSEQSLPIKIWPIDTNGKKRIWRREKNDIDKMFDQGDLFYKETTYGPQLYFKFKGGVEGETPKSFWDDKKYSASEHGTQILYNLFGEETFLFPKSPYAVEDCIKVLSSSRDGIFLDYFAGSGTTAQSIINLNRTDQGSRKYILTEMGPYFNPVLKSRILKVIYSDKWKVGKPISRKGTSHTFKYIRLESYEDATNNLKLQNDPEREKALELNGEFRKEYMLRYWLEMETKGSPSLLNIEEFSDPTAYTLKVKKPGSDEYVEKPVDLIETFNLLIGLHVDHIDVPRTYSAKFIREEDPELPEDQTTRLVLDGRLEEKADKKWWFRKVEGRVCRTPGDKTNMDRVLVIWRKLTGNLEEDNLVLDEWFKKYRLSTQDTEFDFIYVNGSNNLPNLRRDDENWKVRLMEETFHKTMWDVEE